MTDVNCRGGGVFEPWCEFHTKTKENPDGIDCCVHMLEGRTPHPCQFSSLEAAKNGGCEDAEPKKKQ